MIWVKNQSRVPAKSRLKTEYSMNLYQTLLISVVCMRPCPTRIILRCWISWTPAAIHPPPPHPRLLLQHPSSRATHPVPLLRPTPHPKAIETAASTSQVSLIRRVATGIQVMQTHKLNLVTTRSQCTPANLVIQVVCFELLFQFYQYFIVWAVKVLFPCFSVCHEHWGANVLFFP